MSMQDQRKDLLISQGFCLAEIVLPISIQESVILRDWSSLDALIRSETQPGGAIFKELLRYELFTEIEFIISIRSSNEIPDDDGIWHDDGSRLLAFSLSLTLRPECIQGGVLQIRKRERSSPDMGTAQIRTPPFGTMIVFATGQKGFEHQIGRVSGGERIIIAGWCT